MNKLRILLADDHPEFPRLVESLLEPTFEVVGKVSDGNALCEATLRLKPDIVITDISMPGLNGIAAAEQLRKANCNAKIIFLTIHTDPDFIRACLAAGACGYVIKSRINLDLHVAIQQALAGQVFISPLGIEERCP